MSKYVAQTLKCFDKNVSMFRQYFLTRVNLLPYGFPRSLHARFQKCTIDPYGIRREYTLWQEQTERREQNNYTVHHLKNLSFLGEVYTLWLFISKCPMDRVHPVGLRWSLIDQSNRKVRYFTHLVPLAATRMIYNWEIEFLMSKIGPVCIYCPVYVFN